MSSFEHTNTKRELQTAPQLFYDQKMVASYLKNLLLHFKIRTKKNNKCYSPVILQCLQAKIETNSCTAHSSWAICLKGLQALQEATLRKPPVWFPVVVRLDSLFTCLVNIRNVCLFHENTGRRNKLDAQCYCSWLIN